MNISPDQVHALDPVIRDDFLHAFVDALQPVFLVGAAVTLVAFVLAWLLKEVPLRDDHAGADRSGHGPGRRRRAYAARRAGELGDRLQLLARRAVAGARQDIPASTALT